MNNNIALNNFLFKLEYETKYAEIDNLYTYRIHPEIDILEILFESLTETGYKSLSKYIALTEIDQLKNYSIIIREWIKEFKNIKEKPYNKLNRRKKQ